jgi:surface polysaccharide O-acyltransferase-like enzyme
MPDTTFPTTSLQRSRNDGIDAVRYLCMFGVVVYHALPFTPPMPLWAQVVSFACLPGVPFFFVVAGYFLKVDAEFGARVARPLRRLLPVYLFWLCAYIALLEVIPAQTAPFPFREWVWGGPAYHLWFLPALAIGLTLVNAGFAVVGSPLTGLACIVLAGIGLIRGTYHDLLHIPFAASAHGGLFAAPLYIYIGALLARRRFTVPWPWLIVSVILAYGLVATEEVLTARTLGEPARDVTLSSFILGTVMFLVARGLPDSKVLRSAANLGRLTLGIYAIHLAILWLLLPAIGDSNPWSVGILASLAFAVATICSLGMQYVPVLRSFAR